MEQRKLFRKNFVQSYQLIGMDRVVSEKLSEFLCVRLIVSFTREEQAVQLVSVGPRCLTGSVNMSARK